MRARGFFYVNPNLLSPLDLLDVRRTLPVEALANLQRQQERTLQRQRPEASDGRRWRSCGATLQRMLTGPALTSTPATNAGKHVTPHSPTSMCLA
jgi:hypothetical protein